ncbi:hypothetical protein DFS33DRAFT_1384417 [Desarmillaria ectypa]|nr:hypothetical protein DFS33DRAFT_1384417 [Desarmillaria ectypa]
MSSAAAAPSIFGSAPTHHRGSDSPDASPAAGAVSHPSLGSGGVGKQKEALKLRLDLNLEVEITIKAKVNGDIFLFLFKISLLFGWYKGSESASSRASSPGTPAHGQAAAINKQTYAHAVAKPYREALKLRLDLNLEVEISIKAKVNGDITLSLLKSSQWFTINFTIAAPASFVLVDFGASLAQKKDDGIEILYLYDC